MVREKDCEKDFEKNGYSASSKGEPKCQSVLPITLVEEAFDALLGDAERRAVEDVAHTWISYDAITSDDFRTNNALEGFHHAFKCNFGNDSPLLSKIWLISKKRNITHSMRPAELDKAEIVALKRKKSYADNDKHLQERVYKFHNQSALSFVNLRAAMNSTSTPSHHEEDLAASLIMFVLALVGLLFNGLAFFMLLRFRHLRQSAFGQLCASHTVADLGVLLVFCFWAAPMTYLQSPLPSSFVGKKLGQLNILFWNACIYSHLVIASNRFVAIYFPFAYRKLFSGGATFGFILFVWSAAFAHIVAYFWDECFISFHTSEYLWKFAETPCGHVISQYTDFAMGVFYLAVITCLDLATVVRIHRSNREIARIAHSDVGHRQKQEVRFFVQTVCQGVVFFGELTSFYFVSTFFEDQRWPLFLSTTFAWELSHTLDGLILLAFNGGFCLLVRDPKRFFFPSSSQRVFSKETLPKAPPARRSPSGMNT